jgi:putative transposase
MTDRKSKSGTTDVKALLAGDEEIKRRTHVVRILPNGESCLRLVRALAVETHENRLEQHRYLNMDDLREHKKEGLRRAA